MCKQKKLCHTFIFPYLICSIGICCSACKTNFTPITLLQKKSGYSLFRIDYYRLLLITDIITIRLEHTEPFFIRPDILLAN